MSNKHLETRRRGEICNRPSGEASAIPYVRICTFRLEEIRMRRQGRPTGLSHVYVAFAGPVYTDTSFRFSTRKKKPNTIWHDYFVRVRTTTCFYSKYNIFCLFLSSSPRQSIALQPVPTSLTHLFRGLPISRLP